MSRKEKIFFGILIIITTLISIWLIWDNLQFVRFVKSLALRPSLCLTDVQDKVCDGTTSLYKCDYGVFVSPTIGVTYYYDAQGEIIISCGSGPWIKNPLNCRYLAKIECSSRNVCESKLISEEAADWEIYRNEEYGFEVSYPGDWSVNIYENGTGSEFIPINKTKPENIFISVSISTKRPNTWSLGSWLKQIPGKECDSEDMINGIKWCLVTSRFEGVRQDSYATTRNEVDYIVTFNVSYGRQRMDYYISDEELSEEINILNQILSSFRFIKMEEGGVQTIGEPTDGLMLSEIRHSDHGTFYRFVFEIKNQDRTEAQVVPFTETHLYPSAKVLKIEINGIRRNIAGPAGGGLVEIGDTLVASYIQERTYDDQAIQYSIALNKYAEYQLYSLINPIRVIIDIQK